MEFLPVPLPVDELVADDMGFEDARVPEQRHVTGKDVTHAHREGKQDLGEAEAPDLAAGEDPLPRDAGDGGGEPGVDLPGEFFPRAASVAPSGVQAPGERGDLL